VIRESPFNMGVKQVIFNIGHILKRSIHLKVTLILLIMTVFSGCTIKQKVHNHPLVFIDCRYCPIETQDNPYPELTYFKDCAYEDENGGIVIRDNHIKNILFDNDNLASIYFNDTDIVYVNTSGKTAKVLYFDNGADYFQEGLARTIKDGKIGFINKNLDVVILPNFDFAFPFSNGVATVCNGCYIVLDGEYSIVVGGKWGYINKKGDVTLPISYEKDDLPQPSTDVLK
jgi:hypothetical protein